MIKKMILTLLIVLVVISGCVSSLAWTKTDFEAYSASDPELKTFPLKYYGHEINLKLGICCLDYIDSRYTTDLLPVKEIAEYIENKYGVNIDTSEFESHRKNGHFEATVSYNNDGDEILEYYDDFMALNGLQLIGGLLTHASWATLSWSENPENESIFKHEEGKNSQMQIHLATSPIGAWCTIWLRIIDGEPDENGNYEFTTVVKEKVTLPFKPAGCNVEEMAEAIKQIPALLNAQE